MKTLNITVETFQVFNNEDGAEEEWEFQYGKHTRHQACKDSSVCDK